MFKIPSITKLPTHKLFIVRIMPNSVNVLENIVNVLENIVNVPENIVNVLKKPPKEFTNLSSIISR